MESLLHDRDRLRESDPTPAFVGRFHLLEGGFAPLEDDEVGDQDVREAAVRMAFDQAAVRAFRHCHDSSPSPLDS
jgi:hypothetical protein